jgi:putative ABC transport system permease protein
MGASMQGDRTHRMTDVYARLAPGATPEAAQAELRQIASSWHQAYPESYPPARGFDVVVTPWKDELTVRARPMLMILLVTTTFVLIIACANVGNLTLTRLVSRETEMSIRAALGAPTAALRRQLLAENLVLSVLGGLVGLVFAVGGLNLLISYAGRFTNRTGEIGIDGWVLAFTMIVAITIAMLFAWAPRLTFVNDPARAMAGAGGRTAGSPGRRRAQRLLVVSQLAASFMLLIGAGLLTRTLMELYAVDPGFDLGNVLSLQAPDFTAQSRDKRLQFSQEVIDRVKGQASVQNAAMTSAAPLAEAMQMPTEIKVDGAENGNAQVIVTRIVSNTYFDTVGTEIAAGRSFERTDIQKAPPVVIISQAMARFYFRDQSPIGRTLAWRMGPNWSPAAQIVGVAVDTHADGLTEQPKMTLYRPDTQASAVSTLLVRTSGSAGDITPQVVETIRSLDPNRPVDHVQTLEELRDETIAPQRLNATLIGLFALLALAIAMVGVGGVLAFSVSQRTNELGIRMALGAEPSSILRMILGEGAAMAAIGLVIGGLLSAPLSRMLTGLLFGVQPIDLPTITAAAALLVFVALAAAWIPARRAMAVEPMVALRRE